MKVDFLDFDVQHLENLGNHEKQMFVESDSDFDQLCAVTMFVEGKIACIMGVAVFRPGVLDAVLIPGEAFYDNVKTCYRAIKMWLERIQYTINWRRLQALTRVDAPHHIRFIEALGFKKEGRLRQYGTNGYDVFIYSIIKGDT